MIEFRIAIRYDRIAVRCYQIVERCGEIVELHTQIDVCSCPTIIQQDQNDVSVNSRQ